MPLAFAPFYLWPLAILLPSLLIWLIDREFSPKELFFIGMLFGVGYFGFGVYWIYNSLHDFGDAPPVVAGAITALMVICLSVFPGLALSFLGYGRRCFGDKSLWLLPLLWFGMEWIKGWVITGMPWLSLGYSQTGSILSGYAPLIGVYGISAVCILVSVSLYLSVIKKQFLMFVLVIGLPLFGFVLKHIEWTQQGPGSMTVTAVQGNIPQNLKWRHDERQNIFNTYWRETSQHWDSDLIVWPETALPGHSQEIEKQVLTPLQQIAAKQNTPIITGLVVSDGQNDHYYNSAVLLGKERQLYHKRHLVMFGEYYPMRWLLKIMADLINIPFSDLTPGPEQQPLMTVGEFKLGLSICFEDVFSRDIILALPEAHFFINLSNDAWFGDSTAPHQHMQIAQMRSQEFGRAMIRATNTGISTFIDHRGEIISLSSQFKTESLTQEIEGRSGNTPFYYFARIQGFLSPLPFIIVFLLARRKAR